jgi:hypothetical protein
MIKKYIKQAVNWLLNKTTVDETIIENISEAKRRYIRVKQEIQDVTTAISETKNQLDDVVDAVKGSKRPGKKPKNVTKSSLRQLKKATLIKTAKTKFGQTIYPKLPKVKIVNMVYEMYHKK